MTPNPLPPTQISKEQLQLLEQFSAELPAHGRILFAGGSAPAWLRARGFQVEEIPTSKDLRFLSLPREQYDGIWFSQTIAAFSIDEVQRVVAIAFQALKPHQGILFLMHLTDEGEAQAMGLRHHDAQGLASMLRQNGFQILTQGTRAPWTALVLRRISVFFGF